VFGRVALFGRPLPVQIRPSCFLASSLSQCTNATTCNESSIYAPATAQLTSNLSQRHLCMSDPCIVCLGDLSSAGGDVAAPLISPAKSPQTDFDAAAASPGAKTTNDENATSGTTPANKDPDELIAYLQPCGHYLHNECLTPWVERANSCPICRASFHLVELKKSTDGESQQPPDATSD
jgi:hypothetical protein